MPNIKIKSKTEIKPPFAEATEGRSGGVFVLIIDETGFLKKGNKFAIITDMITLSINEII